MDSTRILLWATFSLLLWGTYTAWVTQYPAPAQQPSAQITGTEQLPVPPVPGNDELPQLAEPPALATPTDGAAATLAQPIRIQTDVFQALIDGQGGDLVQVELPGYPIDKESTTPIRLVDYPQQERWVFQTGLRSASGGSEPNHLEEFSAQRMEYALGDGSDELSVTLDWENVGPLRAR